MTTTRKTATVEMTKAELLSAIQECPPGNKKAVQAYVAQIWANKKAAKENAKPGPTIYQLFCYEQRPLITERLIESRDYNDGSEGHDNKALFGAITKELSRLWKQAKDEPEYQKGTQWYKDTLAAKLGTKVADASDTTDDEDNAPAVKTSKKERKPSTKKEAKPSTKKEPKPSTKKEQKAPETPPPVIPEQEAEAEPDFPDLPEPDFTDEEA